MNIESIPQKHRVLMGLLNPVNAKCGFQILCCMWATGDLLYDCASLNFLTEQADRAI